MSQVKLIKGMDRREYMRKYNYERYHRDDDFRKKANNTVKEYIKNRIQNDEEYQKKHMEAHRIAGREYMRRVRAKAKEEQEAKEDTEKMTTISVC